MLSYIRVGANDVQRSGRFYEAILVPLGYALDVTAHGFEFTPGGSGPDVYVGHPYDGEPATVGNGSMLALEAPTAALVRELHRAGLEAGGTDEGAPGFRDAYSDTFYVAYLRDPVGNKLALCASVPA